MERLLKVLMPLVSVIIAFVPQTACEELLALYEAGRLQLIAVEEDGRITTGTAAGIMFDYTDEAGEQHADACQTYIDCTEQKQLSLKDIPFEVLSGSVPLHRPACLSDRMPTGKLC